MSAVKERPIIMSAESVRAILAGTKHQTRRVMKPQPDEDGLVRDLLAPSVWEDTSWREYRCPYGQPGDRLYVRETWAQNDNQLSAVSTDRSVVYRADGETRATDEGHELPWRSPIHMPRWASRLTLEVVSVRVERLQAITVNDVVAEGIDLEGEHADDFLDAGHAQAGGLSIPCDHPEIYPFVRLWDSINGKKPGCAWQDNPWVWRIEFAQVTP